jgi:lysozyme
MTTSPAGRAFIESMEGCRLAAYQDQRGIWTIGYGRILGVTEGMICTQEQADVWLAEDLLMTETAIEHLLPTFLALTQGEYDSIVSLCFNIGQGNFKDSTVRRKLSLSPPDYLGAADAFLLWNKVMNAAGVLVVDPGLERRRTAERAMFLQGTPALANSPATTDATDQ